MKHQAETKIRKLRTRKSKIVSAIFNAIYYPTQDSTWSVDYYNAVARAKVFYDIDKLYDTGFHEIDDLSKDDFVSALENYMYGVFEFRNNCEAEGGDSELDIFPILDNNGDAIYIIDDEFNQTISDTFDASMNMHLLKNDTDYSSYEQDIRILIAYLQFMQRDDLIQAIDDFIESCVHADLWKEYESY